MKNSKEKKSLMLILFFWFIGFLIFEGIL